MMLTSNKTAKITATLKETTIKMLDEQKGYFSRSKYMQVLLDKALSNETHEREVSKESDKSFDHASGGKS
jgi:hypothetical protein